MTHHENKRNVFWFNVTQKLNSIHALLVTKKILNLTITLFWNKLLLFLFYID